VETARDRNDVAFRRRRETIGLARAPPEQVMLQFTKKWVIGRPRHLLTFSASVGSAPSRSKSGPASAQRQSGPGLHAMGALAF
jgi:hypothetical protein